MQAGKLRHRVTLQKLPDEPNRNTFGEEMDDDSQWDDVATVWASVEPLSARERLTAQQLYGEVTGRIRMRYYPGLHPKMRAVFENRKFNIEGIVNKDERNIELELMVTELV